MSTVEDHRSSRRRSARVRLRAVLGIVTTMSLALAVAGCGGSSHASKVASLPTRSATDSHHTLATSDGVPDPGGRPREQLNDTTAQWASLYDPYLACLRAHRYVDQQSATARLTVAAKCVHLEPLAPWALDPANPQARAFIGRTVTCLQAKGYHAQAVLITNVPIQPPEWFVRYSPKALNYTPRRPVAAEDACHERALR